MRSLPFTTLSAALLLFSFGLALGSSDKTPEGFGAISKGGVGGERMVVTSLANEGPGTLREALMKRRPRVIEFGVEGDIDLSEPIVVYGGNVTVDGATAPGKGVTIRGAGLHFKGDCDDIILRHLRLRIMKGGDAGDGITFLGNKGGTIERVLVDHCSILWATDEGFDTWGSVKDLTCQWTIIAEGLSEGDHAKGVHSMGWLSGPESDRISIHHCLFAHNGDRNPKVSGGVYDIVNNVIYNWGGANCLKLKDGARANVVGNCFIPGPDSIRAGPPILIEDAAPDSPTRVYVSGNRRPLEPGTQQEPWLYTKWYDQSASPAKRLWPAPETFRLSSRLPTAAIAVLDANEAYEQVLKNAGPKMRDADEARIIQEVRDRAGRVGGPKR